MGRNGKLKGLTILDMSDRELLLIVMEEAEADPHGFADTASIAERLGLGVKHPNNSTGVRLGYLRRIGAVEKDPESEPGLTRWAVTRKGQSMATGQIRAAAQKQLDSMGEEQMMLMARFVGLRARKVDTASKLIRREWRHTVGQ